MAYFCNGKQGVCTIDGDDPCRDCEYFDGSGGHEIAITTNAEHIRSMSDDELGRFLCRLTECSGCRFCYPSGCNVDDWLQQPYEE